MSVHVDNLVKYYRVHHREAGLRESLRSLFRREYETVRAVDGISFDVEPGKIVYWTGSTAGWPLPRLGWQRLPSSCQRTPGAAAPAPRSASLYRGHRVSQSKVRKQRAATDWQTFRGEEDRE